MLPPRGLQKLLDKQRSLTTAQPMLHHARKRLRLVAARQPAQLPRRGKTQQPQSNMLHCFLAQPFAQRNTTTGPAFVSTEQCRYLLLVEAILPV